MCVIAKIEPQLDYKKVKEDHLKNVNVEKKPEKKEKWMGMKDFINQNTFE